MMIIMNKLIIKIINNRIHKLNHQNFNVNLKKNFVVLKLSKFRILSHKMKLKIMKRIQMKNKKEVSSNIFMEERES